ncbi:unnamed protein product [Choristocarpus tenellus]
MKSRDSEIKVWWANAADDGPTIDHKSHQKHGVLWEKAVGIPMSEGRQDPKSLFGPLPNSTLDLADVGDPIERERQRCGMHSQTVHKKDNDQRFKQSVEFFGGSGDQDRTSFLQRECVRLREELERTAQEKERWNAERRGMFQTSIDHKRELEGLRRAVESQSQLVMESLVSVQRLSATEASAPTVDTQEIMGYGPWNPPQAPFVPHLPWDPRSSSRRLEAPRENSIKTEPGVQGVSEHGSVVSWPQYKELSGAGTLPQGKKKSRGYGTDWALHMGNMNRLGGESNQRMWEQDSLRPPPYAPDRSASRHQSEPLALVSVPGWGKRESKDNAGWECVKRGQDRWGKDKVGVVTDKGGIRKWEEWEWNGRRMLLDFSPQPVREVALLKHQGMFQQQRCRRVEQGKGPISNANGFMAEVGEIKEAVLDMAGAVGLQLGHHDEMGETLLQIGAGQSRREENVTSTGSEKLPSLLNQQGLGVGLEVATRQGQEENNVMTPEVVPNHSISGLEPGAILGDASESGPGSQHRSELTPLQVMPEELPVMERVDCPTNFPTVLPAVDIVEQLEQGAGMGSGEHHGELRGLGIEEQGEEDEGSGTEKQDMKGGNPSSTPECVDGSQCPGEDKGRLNSSDEIGNNRECREGDEVGLSKVRLPAEESCNQKENTPVPRDSSSDGILPEAGHDMKPLLSEPREVHLVSVKGPVDGSEAGGAACASQLLNTISSAPTPFLRHDALGNSSMKIKLPNNDILPPGEKKPVLEAKTTSLSKFNESNGAAVAHHLRGKTSSQDTDDSDRNVLDIDVAPTGVLENQVSEESPPAKGDRIRVVSEEGADYLKGLGTGHSKGKESVDAAMASGGDDGAVSSVIMEHEKSKLGEGVGEDAHSLHDVINNAKDELSPPVYSDDLRDGRLPLSDEPAASWQEAVDAQHNEIGEAFEKRIDWAHGVGGEVNEEMPEDGLGDQEGKRIGSEGPGGGLPLLDGNPPEGEGK